MEPDASSLLQVNTQTSGARSKLTTYVKHQVHFDRQTAEFVGLHAASSNSTDCSPPRSALQMRENEGLQCQPSYLTVCPITKSEVSYMFCTSRTPPNPAQCFCFLTITEKRELSSVGICMKPYTRGSPAQQKRSIYWIRRIRTTKTGDMLDLQDFQRSIPH